jgi:cytochrome c5
MSYATWPINAASGRDRQHGARRVALAGHTGTGGTQTLAHRMTHAGSALYAEICTLCAATDAPGDPRLAKPCLGHF